MNSKTCDKGAVILLNTEKRLPQLNTPSQGKNQTTSTNFSIHNYFQVGYNGCVYETFGISKRFPIKLQLLLIRAETLDKPLTAKCFIYVVVHWCSVFPVIFLSICYAFLSAHGLGQAHLLTSFSFADFCSARQSSNEFVFALAYRKNWH